MAVAEIGKLNLVAMSYDKDALLNALHRTGAVEIKLHTQTESTVALCADGDGLRAYLARVEGALSYLAAKTDAYNKEHKIKSDLLQDGFEITYARFMSAADRREETDALTDRITAAEEREKSLSAELSKVRRAVAGAEIYSTVESPLDGFKSTPHVAVRLGVIPVSAKEALFAALDGAELAAYAELNADAEYSLVVVAAHKCVASDVENALSAAGFALCPYNDGRSGKEIYLSLKQREGEILKEISRNEEELISLSPSIKDLKVYCDYLGYELEKAELADKLRATQTTFLLEAYYPKGEEEAVKAELAAVTDAFYLGFSEPADDEVPPTLYRNNAVVKNFETITNMYSPVNSREFDPNAIMAFFYSVFLGFIMADVGYGLIMVGVGGFIYLRTKRDCGLRRLAGVFAVGGIFAIIWGVLFNSFFGIPLGFMPTVMPDAQTDMWSLLGISIPSVLIISLEIGVVQLMAGYICRAWQCWRRGQIADGILDGLVWAVFSVGVGLAIVGLIDEAGLPVLATAGGITAGACLLVAMLTAGRKEKLLGKFTKGFGAAYGIINYASDVLSYARLYGLMLSGAVIAQIVSQYAVEFITGGNVGFIIIGIILMAVGHVFNLAIGLLGAYIHDARLQYVEFYGRFYEGEGELFTPLGSTHKYVYLPVGRAVK